MNDAAQRSPEGARMLEYLTTRAAGLGVVQIRARCRAAVAELDSALAGITEAEARRHPVAGQWSIAEVVDHLAQTTIRVADELRHLLGGRRPPGPPVYEALTSGAAVWAPWPELLEGLRAANEELDHLLAGASGTEPAGAPTARTILVVNRTGAGGRVTPEVFSAELGWKEYALVQRLHLLDHRTQVRTLRATVAGGSGAATG
ncbi:MAG TPA: DinB family protein [Methylomirabilota bacterium]|nr:DinB family protein [Methylomirabilota bacterium]